MPEEHPDEAAAEQPRSPRPKKSSSGKKKKHKRGQLANHSVSDRSQQYGKQKDLFPELTHMPEFANYKPGGDDDSFTSGATRYETKEDQDVAVFMALASRMNIDSLLFILTGHAREQNLPSAEMLMPENAHLLKQARDAARKQKKNFGWKEDAEGNVALEIFEIVPMKEENLWFDDEFSQKILLGAIRDVRYYQANKPDYINSVETLATQQDSTATEGHMKTLINDKHARGLEVHICSYIEEVRRDFINCVLDEQDDCEDANENYDDTAARLRKAALQYTVQAQEFAYKLAKCDHIVALKASLSKWDKPKNSKKKPGQPISRCKDGTERKKKGSSKQETVA